jgi:hypothetical protein
VAKSKSASSSSRLRLPARRDEKIVKTAEMLRAINRTLGIHPIGRVTVWSGPSGNGKSTTAQYLVQELERATINGETNAFRAQWIEFSSTYGAGADKRVIRAIYHGAVQSLTEGAYRRLPAGDLARELIGGLQARNIQMLLLDEAGVLSEEALRGICLIVDTAKAMGWHLSVVLIGMDDLPRKVESCPQLKGRVREWCYFKPYTFLDTWNFLAALHPYFNSLDRDNEDHRAQVDYVWRSQRGLPNELVTFLQKLDNFGVERELLSLEVLTAVDRWTELDREKALAESRKGWQRPVVGDDNDGDGHDKPLVVPKKRRSKRQSSAA